jgi:hypothetical protein
MLYRLYYIIPSAERASPNKIMKSSVCRWEKGGFAAYFNPIQVAKKYFHCDERREEVFFYSFLHLNPV